MGGILRYIFCIFLLFSSPFVLSTSFAPIHIREKVEDSDAVVMGTVVKSYYTRNSRGRIYTVVVLDIEKTAGLKLPDNISSHNFRVRYLGGKWGDRVQEVPGSPKFSFGEKVVLLLGHHKNLFFIHHLAAGKFSLVKKSGKEFLVSEIFSEREGIGKISLDEFNQILQNSHLGTPLSYNIKQRQIFVEENSKRGKFDEARNLASPNKDTFSSSKSGQKGSGRGNLFLIFLVVLFLSLGLVILSVRIKRIVSGVYKK